MGWLLGQSVLMALTVTVNKLASSNVKAVNLHSRTNQQPKQKHKHTPVVLESTTRRLLISTTLLAASSQLEDDSKTQLLQRYLQKSEDNKAKNDKERLDSYYKRNYKDYFDFVEGSIKGKTEQDLTEAEKSIIEWLKKNKQ